MARLQLLLIPKTKNNFNFQTNITVIFATDYTDSRPTEMRMEIFEICGKELTTTKSYPYPEAVTQGIHQIKIIV